MQKSHWEAGREEREKARILLIQEQLHDPSSQWPPSTSSIFPCKAASTSQETKQTMEFDGGPRNPGSWPGRPLPISVRFQGPPGVRSLVAAPSSLASKASLFCLLHFLILHGSICGLKMKKCFLCCFLHQRVGMFYTREKREGDGSISLKT